MAQSTKPGSSAARVEGLAWYRAGATVPMLICQSDPRSASPPIVEDGHPMPLAETDIKELLSFAYMRAIAARAGFRVNHPYPDRQHDDLQIDACGRLDPDGWSAARLDFQVRATTTIPPAVDGEFGFQIERPLYDDLRDDKRCVPLLLAVFIMPTDPAQWLSATDAELITRHCAYWCHIKGAPPIETDSRVVHVKRVNTLTPTSLTALMRIAGRRQEIGDAL